MKQELYGDQPFRFSNTGSFWSGAWSLTTASKRRFFSTLLPLSLALSACGQERPRLALPPSERAEPVAAPVIPQGNSDAEVATLIADYDAALRTANARLLWLKDWILTAGK